MPNQKPKYPTGKSEERLKEELRRLEKVQAPWYFESDLQQKIRAIQSGQEKRGWFSSPIPSFALSALGALMLAAAGYYFLYLPGTMTTEQHIPALNEKPVEAAPLQAPPPGGQAATQEQPPGEMHPSQRGPSPPAEQPRMIRPLIHPTITPAHVDSANAMQAPALATPETSRVHLLAPSVRDTLKAHDTTKVIKDSIRARRDTSGLRAK